MVKVCWRPLGELTALPRPLTGLTGGTKDWKGGKGNVEKRGEGVRLGGKGVREEHRRGREGKRKGGRENGRSGVCPLQL